MQDVAMVAEQGLHTIAKMGKGPWLEDGQEIKPCWSKSNFGKLT